MFVPQHPATVSTVEEVRAAEANLDIEKLVQMGLDQVEIQAFEFPESASSRRQAADGGGQKADGVKRET